MRIRYLFGSAFFIGFSLIQTGWSQIANFAVPASACLNQAVTMQNSSSGANQYVWDFCQDGLSHLTSYGDAVTVNNANIPVGLKVVYDQGQWFGFVCGRDAGGNKLTRLDFGNSLNNSPAMVDLSSLLSAFTGTSEIKFIRQNGLWYGFATDYYTNSIIRLGFGNQLSNTPTATNLGNLGGGDGLYGIDLAKQGTNYFAMLTYSKSDFISILNFGSSITGTPSVTNLTNALVNTPVKIEILNKGSNWYAFVSSLGNSKILLLNFGTDLSMTPVFSVSASIPGAAGLQIVKDGSAIFGFVFDSAGKLSRLDFGTSASSIPTVIDLGFPGNTNIVYGLSIVKEWPNWKGLFVEVYSKVVHIISFTDQCNGISPIASNAINPIVRYSTEGNKLLELAAISSGIMDTVSHPLTVLNLAAPQIDMAYQNICVSSPILFGEVSTSGPPIASRFWDFGDGNTSTLPAPTNQYVSVGNYNVTLDVTASNSCSNRVVKALQIFNPPSPNFTLPSPAVVCTNQYYAFTNSTTYDIGSTPTWQWSVNGTNMSSAQDLITNFSSVALQQITLSASIPGCSAQLTKNLNVQQSGPLVDFTAGNGCNGQPLSFVNNSGGSITAFAWDFGDGNTSSNASPSNSYVNTGVYTVSLSTSSSNGCNNNTSKTVQVYTTPQPDFNLGLPPFSCSGTPSQFNDATPNPTDSNLSSWAWAFGDAANGSSTQRNPLYTYPFAGPYTVGMTATTNFGCSATIQKSITITQSPIASFANTVACVNQGTQFTDTSIGSIKSWLWKIGISNYTINNPVHVFSSPANYTVQLTVTDNNSCITQTTSSVSVPIAPLLDFSAQSTCATKPAIFQDITPAGTDPLVSYSWDFAGQGSGAGTPSQFIFPATGNFSVKMDARAQSGCVYSVTKTVSIVSPPKSGFATSTDAGPAPLIVQFDNTSVNASTYLWHFNDQTNSTSVVPSPSFTFTDLGDYVVDLDAMSVQGCVDTFGKIIRAVLPKVDAGLSSLQFIRDPSSGQLRVLFVLANLGNIPLSNPTIVVEISGNATLIMNLNLVLLPGQTASQLLNYSFLSTGLRYVCLRVETSGDADSYNDKECVSLNQETIVFAPYPNPVNGELHFDWIATGDEPAQITIFNGTGAKSLERQLELSQSGLNQIRIDISNLGPGVYLALFTQAGLKKTFRFIVN